MRPGQEQVRRGVVVQERRRCARSCSRRCRSPDRRALRTATANGRPTNRRWLDAAARTRALARAADPIWRCRSAVAHPSAPLRAVASHAGDERVRAVAQRARQAGRGRRRRESRARRGRPRFGRSQAAGCRRGGDGRRRGRAARALPSFTTVPRSSIGRPARASAGAEVTDDTMRCAPAKLGGRTSKDGSAAPLTPGTAAAVRRRRAAPAERAARSPRLTTACARSSSHSPLVSRVP